MIKQKRKSKRDLYGELDRIKKLETVTQVIMFLCGGILFSLFWLALPDILNPERHILDFVSIVAAVSFLTLLICGGMQEPIEVSIKELEKQIQDQEQEIEKRIREEERRFPPDILDPHRGRKGMSDDNEARHTRSSRR